MKYRWGFDVAGVFTECEPLIEDSTSLDYSQQSGEVFYRAKLNGTLTFRFELFDSLIAAGYNVEHQVVLQYYDENANTWAECWRGRFTLTDCEIDFDTNTISVQPETLDRYTAVLDELENEYNLTKLAVQQQKVNIKIRPCVQLYALNDSKITNIIGHNTWEASCDSVGSADIDSYKFKAIGEYFAFNIKFSSYATVAAVAGQTIVFSGVPDYSGTPKVFNVTGTYWNGSAYDSMTLRCRITQYPDETVFNIYWPSGGGWEGTPFISATFASNEAGTDAAIYIRDEGESNAYAVDANAQWIKLYTRTLVQTESAYIFLYGVGFPTYDIADNDMAGANMNYNKIIQETATKNVFSSVVSGEPTEWGLNYNDKYYVKPSDTALYHYFPVAQTQWKYFSWWAAEEYQDGQKITDELDRKAAADRTIKDGYKLAFVVLGLLRKNGWTGAGWISRVLGGSGDNFVNNILPVITPKSNVISSYYDTPAQNAPINLQKIFSMLKQAYKIYWHIDANGYIHVEHISYYENGGNYDETAPQLLIDLESRIHTNTKENKVFGQNKVKFEKSEMPQQYAFAWMDSQTHPFDGWAINCIDNYVQKGVKDEKTIAFFSTDVDFCLSSPGDMSRDGFFLFALPLVGGTYPNTLQIEKVRIKDDAGDTYEVTIQNADAAFCKIHESYWKYDLPCENINVNNKDTTAKSTGKYKLQTVEFADTVLADILADVDNCNKVVRTQQGDGKIKTLSINLNSLAAKADLLFNFIGRFYYLKGTAIGASITILINGESTTINVASNKWNYRYNEPLTALIFNGADVVSVNLADCDRLESVTTCNDMFKNCAELLAVDFGGKKLAAVTSATDMFAGCAQLTTLVCPQTSTWKPDLSFADCPDLTTESIYSLLGYLYSYDSGVHTIDFNSTMWDALDADTQTDITTKAGAKGWTIGTATTYYISGQSAASTVYATINGLAVEIPVSAGAFNYAYNAPITSFSFENDADVTDIDFSLSDGLAGVTSLANAFKNCAGLTTLDFTNCDLTNVTTASDCFAGCVALYTLEIPTGTWKPDVDLSDTVILYSEMLNVVDGLYGYTGGVHNVTFNSTIWDTMSVADQQIVFDAAQLKGWTTNAVAVVYYIKGKSTAASETFDVQFIDNGSIVPSATETITCAVDGSGHFEYSYYGKKIYSLKNAFKSNTTITQLEFTELFDALTDIESMCESATNLSALVASNATFESVLNAKRAFSTCGLTAFYLPSATFASVTDGDFFINDCHSLISIDLPNATFASVTTAQSMIGGDNNLTSLSIPNATFASVSNAYYMFAYNTKITSISLPLATFVSATDIREMFRGNTLMQSVMLAEATFASATICTNMFYQDSALTSVSMPKATFGELLTARTMFNYCTSNFTLNLPNATFAKLTDMWGAFSSIGAQSISLPEATFGLLQNVQYLFQDSTALQSLSMPKATFASITECRNIFNNCNSLSSIDVPQNSTAILATSNPTNTPLNIGKSPLDYASMLKIANWLSDLTGYSAHTCTFKASAWNALTTAEQNNIDTILSGKNWNRAIA